MSSGADGATELNLRASVTADGKVQILSAIEKFGEERGWARSIRNELALILEEWLTNILSYSRAPSSSEMTLALKTSADDLWLEIRDRGESFNPLEAPAPDRETPLEKRHPGGYGIAMVKQLVDEMEWERIGGQNVLRLRKSARVPKLPG
jgi:serine/threonine-protein kinase RsbW